MNQESISACLDKFVKYGITIEEIKLIAPLVGDEDFAYQYELTENLKELIIEEGTEELRNELNLFIAEETQSERYAKVLELRNYRIQIAAVLLVGFCVFGVVKSTTGYNNEVNFSKSYIEKK